ncbi:MAG: hypothetical protein IIC01_07980 [Planctomycetes bacterium]|nr:hypothetical protein [Planctomycetota bacterium]
MSMSGTHSGAQWVMNMAQNGGKTLRNLGILLMCTFALVGCRKEQPKFEIVSLEGTVEKIERGPDNTGVITVAYYNDKQQQETLGTGNVTPETEIMINGAAATLADLRVGDRIRGQVRIEKKGEQRIQIAVKIHVDRPEPLGHDPG